jgi:phage terminase small subunit
VDLAAVAVDIRLAGAVVGAMAELTDKQRLFVDHYLACLNASEAARRAGYPDRSAYSVGWENLRKPEIRAAIDAALAEAAMPASEVLARLTDQARASMQELTTVRGRGLTLDLKAAKDRGVLHLVKKYTKTKQSVTVELYDGQAALALLAKYHGLLVDRQELSGPGGAPLTPPIREVVIARPAVVDDDAPVGD